MKKWEPLFTIILTNFVLVFAGSKLAFSSNSLVLVFCGHFSSGFSLLRMAVVSLASPLLVSKHLMRGKLKF